jgi:hypothetical protein
MLFVASYQRSKSYMYLYLVNARRTNQHLLCICTLDMRLAFLREQDVPRPEGFLAVIAGFSIDGQVRVAS